MLETVIVSIILILSLSCLVYIFIPSSRNFYKLPTDNEFDLSGATPIEISIDEFIKTENDTRERFFSKDVEINWKINVGDDNKKSLEILANDLLERLSTTFDGFNLYQAMMGDASVIEHIKRLVIRSYPMDSIEKMDVMKKMRSNTRYVFGSDFFLISVCPVVDIKYKITNKKQ